MFFNDVKARFAIAWERLDYGQFCGWYDLLCKVINKFITIVCIQIILEETTRPILKIKNTIEYNKTVHQV